MRQVLNKSVLSVCVFAFLLIAMATGLVAYVIYPEERKIVDSSVVSTG